MVTQQLLDYIKQQLQMGKTQAETKQSLVAGGWKAEDIDQGFTSVTSGVPAAPTGTEVPKARQIYSGSWVIYKNRFKTLIAIGLIPVAAYLILGLIAGLGFFTVTILKFNLNGWDFLAAIILAIIAFIFIIYLAFWGVVAQLFAIKDQAEGIGWKEAFRRSKNKINPFFSTSILMGLISFGVAVSLVAIFFLITMVLHLEAAAIPLIIVEVTLGIWTIITLTLWFSQSPYIVVEENLANIAALKRSKYYVKERLGLVFGKLFYISIISFCLLIAIAIVVSVLTSITHVTYFSLLNNIFQLIWTPMITVYSYQLYKYLKASRP